MIEAYLPALATAVGSGLKAFGLFSQGQAGVTAANRRKQASEFEAQQMDQNAITSVAASQRVAYARGREADLMLSTLRARAAASGAGASDPTVLNLQAGLMGQKAYNLAAALYEGQDRARTLRMGAAGKRYEGAAGVAGAKEARRAYNFSALSSLATDSVAESLRTKYSGGITPEAGPPGGFGRNKMDDDFDSWIFNRPQ
jgi:hypothetical protein